MRCNQSLLRIVLCSLSCAGIFLAGLISCDLGERPVGPSVNATGEDGDSRNLRIRALPSTVAADYDAQSVIEVTFFDENRNPVEGNEVTFSVSKGIVSASDTTDEDGIARAVFTSDVSSGDAVITARTTLDGTVFIIRDTITIRGTLTDIDSMNENMRIRATPTSISASYDEHSLIEVTVFDDNHNPIGDKDILFTATRGVISALGVTDSNGIATALFTGETGGGDATISARMLLDDSVLVVATTVKLIGASLSVDSSNKNMRIRAFPSNLLASFDETAEIEVTIFDENHNPLSGREIRFSSDAGTITRTDTTGEDGIATAEFSSEPLNADVQVTASMSVGDSTMSVATTVTLDGIEVMVIPQLSSAPLDVVVPVTIRLLDGKGEPIPDRTVLITTDSDSVGTTNGAGEVETSVSAATAGNVTVRAEALGAVDSASVYFGNTAPVDNDNTIRSIRLFTSHSQLRADNSAEATVTAIIISEDSHNPLVGETVQFSSTLGIIEQYGTTDSTGRTSVTLRSAPVNGECVIRGVLTANSSLKDSTTILFSGVTLEMSVDKEDLGINDTAQVQALLKDGSGNPISSDHVTFSVEAPAVFTDGMHLVQTALSATGLALTEVTSQTAGTVTVHASSANITDSIEVTFSTNNLVVSSSEKSLVIGGEDSAKITAVYKDKSGEPIEGKKVTFATNAGTLTALSDQTDENGRAVTWLKSGYFSTEATVQAKSSDGSAYTTVFFTASEPDSIQLTVTPDNIGVNGGIAELIATVLDDSGNVVSGAEVSFKIVKGPGGGEHIEKPIIISTNDGIARANLKAGSLPSTYRGCEIEASVGGKSDRTKLTISGEPYTITVSRPEDDTVKVPEAGIRDESTFEFFIGAVVKDVNGNPVADGTPVNFSAFVSGMEIGILEFDHWAGIESSADEIKPVYRWKYIKKPFEDVNGNFRMDVGIDLELDGNDDTAARGDDVDGNGTMDYDIEEHDFIWPFEGHEPYWPASKEYITITDPTDGRFREPDTLVNERIEMRISALITPDSASVTYDTNYVLMHDTSIVYPAFDSTYTIFADLNQNGQWDRSPLVDNNNNGVYDGPPSKDFEHWRWEMRPQFKGERLDFSDNDVSMVIDRTAVTKDGVAYTRLTYPRQVANRIIATVNAEVKGIRDKDGERFTLPVIR